MDRGSFWATQQDSAEEQCQEEPDYSEFVSSRVQQRRVVVRETAERDATTMRCHSMLRARVLEFG